MLRMIPKMCPIVGRGEGECSAGACPPPRTRRPLVSTTTVEYHRLELAPANPARIELDERLVRDMLGLDEAAVATVARLRTLLATDPSIHGSKKPALP